MASIPLKVARKAAKLTQVQLSKMTGISQGHLSHLERYETQPAFETVQRLAKAVGVKPSQLRFKNEGAPA